MPKKDKLGLHLEIQDKEVPHKHTETFLSQN